ncbi:MAG: T9SS type A sorting domain-containing protein, partial [Crocinitomicaceae bacterium]|nr:T9SS type A sorting domain-containing protein [Crocinitomicaceae bacterium]
KTNGLDSLYFSVTNSFNSAIYDQDTVVYYINSSPLPYGLLPDNIDTCANAITLNAGPNAEFYNWGSGYMQYDSIHAVYSSGDYIVSLISDQGCFYEDTVTVNLFEIPFVNLGNDLSVCADSLELEAQSNGSYFDWGAGYVLHDSLNTINNGGQYIVNVKTDDQCFASDTIEINLLITPIVDLGPDTATCEANFQLNAGSDGNYFDWGSGFVLNDSIHDVTNSGIYTVIVENSVGCQSSDTIEVILKNCTMIESNSHSETTIHVTTDKLLYVTSDFRNANLIIIDAAGRIHVSKKLDTGSGIYNLSDYFGVYLVVITNDSGERIKTARIILP